jgi:uncharacterized radical SAM superfamily Fe-S cluster-containing enzyme
MNGTKAFWNEPMKSMPVQIQSQSICPRCGKPAAAVYIERGGAVFFEINCEEHGIFSTLAGEDAGAFQTWTSHESITVPPRLSLTKGAGHRLPEKDGRDAGPQVAVATADFPGSECPLHCGVCENHLMTACCVLLDITDRCNQQCPYCFAKAEMAGANEDPSLAVIEGWYARLLSLGEERPFNIQLSGGEPTVRDDLPAIVRMGRDKGFEYIQLNTNGRRLALEEGYGAQLKDAGVSAVFLQFDGTTDAIYKALRNEPLLHIKQQAIENCGRAGLPVTLVPTVVKDVNLKNIGEMCAFLLKNLHVVRGIHFQPVSFFGRCPETETEGRVTMFSVMREIERQTGGQIRYTDLAPITTGHPLCCFCGSFLMKRSGKIISLISDEQRNEGVSCCCAPEPDPIEIIRKDRDFVLNKWTAVGGEGAASRGELGHESQDDILSLDDALYYLQRRMFTISGMAFMDRSNLDAARLRRCRVQVFTKDEKLIPFCAYNSIYRV